MKYCTECKIDKSILNFRLKNDRGRKVYYSKCKSCELIIKQRYQYKSQDVGLQTCLRCGITKKLVEFSKNKRRSNGRAANCKSCYGLMKKDYFNRVKLDIEWKQRIQEINNVRSRRLYHKSLFRRAKQLMATRYRQLKLKQVTPSWVYPGSYEYKRIQNLYILAKVMKNELKLDIHIDHIIPLTPLTLNHPQGLHIFSNLRLYPASLNCSENNKRII